MTVKGDDPEMSHRILIVEDEDAISFALGDFFGARGYLVDTAADIPAAAELLARRAYAVVLTDLSLDGGGGTEGLELATLVRTRQPAARIVILTAYGSPEAEALARRIGVDAFLHKPAPLCDIADLFARLLQRPPAAAAPPHTPLASGTHA